MDLRSEPHPSGNRSYAEVRRQRILMAAPFQIVLRGPEEHLLHQAALDLFGRTRELEELLSRFLPDSEICILNNMAAGEPVRVESTTFACLLRCRRYWQLSQGAFDITVAPLLELWDIRGKGRVPEDRQIEQARSVVGMEKVLFEEPSHLVYFSSPGVSLDLGAVGKGTAVDECLLRLRETWRVPEAYLSFGRSTIGVIGSWQVELTSPCNEAKTVLALTISDEALSMSTAGPRRLLHGAYRDRAVDHIIDPRTGKARAGVLAVAAVGSSAEALDALTTALVVSGREEAPRIAARFGARVVVFTGEDEVPRILEVKTGTWRTGLSP